MPPKVSNNNHKGMSFEYKVIDGIKIALVLFDPKGYKIYYKGLTLL